MLYGISVSGTELVNVRQLRVRLWGWALARCLHGQIELRFTWRDVQSARRYRRETLAEVLLLQRLNALRLPKPQEPLVLEKDHDELP